MAEVSIPLKQKYLTPNSSSGGKTKARTGSGSATKKARKTAGNGPRKKAYGPF